MIAGLMREGKEITGKEIAGKEVAVKEGGGGREFYLVNELGVVEGTTRISADPVTACCCFNSLIL